MLLGLADLLVGVAKASGRVDIGADRSEEVEDRGRDLGRDQVGVGSADALPLESPF